MIFWLMTNIKHPCVFSKWAIISGMRILSVVAIVVFGHQKALNSFSHSFTYWPLLIQEHSLAAGMGEWEDKKGKVAVLTGPCSPFPVWHFFRASTKCCMLFWPLLEIENVLSLASPSVSEDSELIFPECEHSHGQFLGQIKWAAPFCMFFWGLRCYLESAYTGLNPRVVRFLLHNLVGGNGVRRREDRSDVRNWKAREDN